MGELKFRQELFDDFQSLTLENYKLGQLYGLEKFWAFLKYSKQQNEIIIEPTLKDALARYKTLEDFRADPTSYPQSAQVRGIFPREVSRPSSTRGSISSRMSQYSISSENEVSISEFIQEMSAPSSKNIQI